MFPYNTRGEFIQALKSVKELDEKIEIYSKKIDDLNYLLYHKVKSPLDYDVVCYENGEAIRLIKSGHMPTASEISALRESLDKELEKTKALKKQCKLKRDTAINTLKKMDEPLQTICYEKYVKGMTYRQLTKRHSEELFYEMNVLRYINAGIDNFIKGNE